MNINGRPLARSGNVNGRPSALTALAKGKPANQTLSYTGYHKGGSIAIGANTGMNSQVMYRFAEAVNYVRFAYGEFAGGAPDNTTSPSLAACPEIPAGVTITFTGRVFYGSDVTQDNVAFNPGSTSGANYASTAVTFPISARTSATVTPGQIIYSDWIAVPAGTTKVCLRTWATWSGTMNGGSGGTGFYGTSSFYNEIWELGASSKISGGSIAYGQSPGSNCAAAIHAEGKVATQVSKPRVLVIGDSRMSCAPVMHDPGFWVYSSDPLNYAIAQNNYSHTTVTLAQSSEKLSDIVADRWVLRKEWASKVDYVVLEHGYNDLGDGASTILSRYRELKTRVNDLGAKLIITTIYPNTSGANTVKGTFDATRVSVNNSIRSGLGDLHDGYLDFADAIETDATNKATPVRNGGFFIKPDGATSYGGYTPSSGNIYGDETHISDTGRLIIGYSIYNQLNRVMPLPNY